MAASPDKPLTQQLETQDLTVHWHLSIPAQKITMMISMELKFYFSNFPKALFKDCICKVSQTFAKNSPEVLSDGCISRKASRTATRNGGPDRSLALMNTFSEDYNDDFNGTEILFLKLYKGTF